MNEQINNGMHELTSKQMKWMNKQANYEQMNEWTNKEQMNEWTNKPTMNRLINEWTNITN